jgi:acyl carrier protein phosphodiesterase
MNYLAHALLAEPHAYSVIGNIAGDLVKGRLESHPLHPRVADGVRRHRRVDALTDAHPRYRELKLFFPREHRRIAAIVLDVLFDHYLTRDWSQLSSIDRDAFIDDVYAVLAHPDAPLPVPLRQRAPQWVAADWLRVYRDIDGVAAVLDRLSRRAQRRLPLMEALAVVQHHERELRDGFQQVFVDVRAQLDGLAGPRRQR